MPTITSAGSGNASAGATWVGGVAPVSTDDAVIAKNHDVKLDTTGLNWKSLTLNNGTTTGDVGAILSCTTSANWSLTLQEGITTTHVTTAAYMSSVNLDMSSTNTYSGTLTLNNANGTTDGNGIALIHGNYQLKGYPRKRWSTINSALVANTTLSVVVADATGWAVGDRLCFACTEGYATSLANLKIDWVTIATITPGSGTTATVTWTDGAGTGGAVKYAHASACPVGNFSSNLTIKPGTDYYRASIKIDATRSGTADGLNTASYISDVCFYRMRGSGYGASPLGVYDGTSIYYRGPSSCAFYDCYSNACFVNSATASGAVTGGPGVSWCISGHSATSTLGSLVGTGDSGAAYKFGDISDCAVFSGSSTGVSVNSNGMNVVRLSCSGIVGAGGANGAGALMNSGASQATISDSQFFSNYAPAIICWTTNTATNCSFGSKVFANALNYDESAGAYSVVQSIWAAQLLLEDCELADAARIGSSRTAPGGNAASDQEGAYVQIKNRNSDAAVQQIFNYHSDTVPVIQRDATTKTRSTSSICFTLNTTTAQTWETEVLAKTGETITILVYVRKSSSPAYGASTLPSVTISGLGITPVVTTMAGGTAADTWELLTCQATNTGSADGLLTVTFTAQSSTAGAKAYFSGMPFPPFVSRARHYGKVFNETSPTVTTDVLASANEATAAGYTGITITWDPTESSIEINGSTTFQKLYDYHQSQAVLNVGSALALTGAGAAGSPALFAAGNVTISDGAVLNGSGSIAMGSYTLATEFAGGSDYTYTGGTWSQLTTVPTFSGGTLTLGAAATLAFTSAAAMIITFTPSAPSTYDLSDCTFSGEQDLRNAAAHAITVEVPAGTSYTTANNTGGAITVSEPQLYQSVTISGARANTRVQLYDLNADSGAEELYNDIPESWPFTWTDPNPAVAERSIRMRLAYYSEDSADITADIFVDKAIGTCGTTEETADVSYLHEPQTDSVYETNGTIGGDVTGIDVSDAYLLCRIARGSVSWAEIYAYNVYWLWTEEGIRDEGSYITAQDTANYLVYDFKIINVSDPVVPLVITGGYGRSGDTGMIADIIDTSGGSIFPQVDHVVGYATGDGPLTVSEKAQLSAIYYGVDNNLDAPVSGVPAAVRSELTTELGRIDVATSTRASQESVDNLAIAGTAYHYAPTSATRTVGSDQGGTFADLAAHDEVYFSTGEVVGAGLDVVVTRETSVLTYTPSTVHVSGYYSGSTSHSIEVYLWNYASSSWMRVGTMMTRTSAFDYLYPADVEHVDPSTGEMKIRFLHNTVSPYVAAHRLHLDYISFEKVASESSLGSDVAAIYTLLQDVDNEVDALPDSEEIADAVWDEVLTGASHNVPSSAGRRLRQITSDILHEGTAQGAGTGNNQIRLASDASASDGAYDPGLICICAGAGAGQSRIILEYVGSTRTATVNRDWKVAVDNTSEYIIQGFAALDCVNEGILRGATTNTATLNTLASEHDDAYIGQLLFLVSGAGQDQTGLVIDYNGTTKVATIAGTWAHTPDTTTGYVMLPSSPVLLGATNHAGATIPDLTDVKEKVAKLHGNDGLDTENPLEITDTSRKFGSVEMTIADDGTKTTVTRIT